MRLNTPMAGSVWSLSCCCQCRSKGKGGLCFAAVLGAVECLSARWAFLVRRFPRPEPKALDTEAGQAPPWVRPATFGATVMHFVYFRAGVVLEWKIFFGPEAW